MISIMGRRHTLRQRAMAFVGAFAIFASLIAVFAPVASASIDISIPINTQVKTDIGSETLLATVATGEFEGQVCEVSADSMNQESIHPGNDLVVASNDTSVVLEDVEGESNGIVHADGTLTLGDVVTVTLINRQVRVFSAGITVLIDCTPTAPEEGSVNVTSGDCTVGLEGEEPGFVSVVIDPENSATVTVSDSDDNAVETFTASGSANLDPGDYSWSAVPSDGFVLVGATSGSFAVADCPDEAEVSDLEVTKIDLVDPVTVDTDNPTALITYEITVTNNGPSVAENVVVTDTLPVSLTYVSASSDTGACSHASGVVTCELGDMAVGASVKITVVVETEAVGSVSDLNPVNTVVVDSDTDDNNPDNNSDEEDTGIVEVLDTEVEGPDVLPFTGIDSDMLLVAALALLGLGSALLWVTYAEEQQQID